MKYTFQIVDVFSSTRFGGNQLAILPDAVGISTEGMKKIAPEFNFGDDSRRAALSFIYGKRGLAKCISGLLEASVLERRIFTTGD